MEKDQRYEIVENLDQYRIGIDDVFAFKCRECGKCCRDREDILLNSRDVYNIATTLNLTHEQVIEKYCEVYIGQESQIPVVRLMPKGPNRNCPLLKGDRCLVHSMKPTVCALFPLGRVVSSEHAPEDAGFSRPYEIEYILNKATCGSLKRKQTVRSWLEMFSISADDQFFIEWNKAVFKIITTVKQYKGRPFVTDKVMEMMWGAIFSALYADYDTSKDFYLQFQDNITKITNVFSKLEVVANGLV